ncbi:hypothetical protein HMPREF1870_00345 [Bacteroidales bacterium KA00344]|nr:hypothetical protein HMPREF1870_00345 [Bacteroidales bacterium KA00344]
MKTRSRIIVMCVPLLLASCGAKKAAIKDTSGVTKTSSAQETSRAAHQLAFVQKVNDQKVYANNIVADMSFTAQMGDRKITVPGAVHMRRDEVIRLQLFIPLLGSEVGRLEFTPDYVLVIDRMHKQYIKGDYNQLDFLRNNGLNFYSLQALFWNQLLLPGASNVGEGDLHKFKANLDGMGQNVPVSLQNGNMNYVWEANRKSGIIGKTSVTFSSSGHGKSNLVWEYTDFSPLGVKMFPATQEFSFSTSSSNKIQEMTVRLKMDKLKTSENWETRSTVSPRYKEMDAKFIFDRLLNM